MSSLNETKIVNVKVAYIRSQQYDNLREWMEDDNNIYIGRHGRVFINKVLFSYQKSMWHNPFKTPKDGSLDEILIKYEDYIREKIKNENLHNELMKLKGKNLGCWCKPEKCHGDVLLKIINEESLVTIASDNEKSCVIRSYGNNESCMIRPSDNKDEKSCVIRSYGNNESCMIRPSDNEDEKLCVIRSYGNNESCMIRPSDNEDEKSCITLSFDSKYEVNEYFNLNDLELIKKKYNFLGYEAYIYCLHDLFNGTDEAYILVVRNGVSIFSDKNELYQEYMENKPLSQNISSKTFPLLREFRKKLPEFFGNKARSLKCKSIRHNKYHDDEKSGGIGIHLGSDISLNFQWKHKKEYVSHRFECLLENGDIYIMSQKAIGTDWREQNIPTLRHMFE
jgi:hypothetical protein